MFVRLGAVFCLILQASTVFAAPDIGPRPLSSAFSAAARGDWATADALAAKAAPEARTLMQWIKLRSGQGTPEEALAFLAAYPHWPGLERLKTRSEKAFAKASVEARLAFFKQHAPQTGTGVLAYADALFAAGEKGEAEATLVMAWRSFDLTADLHDAFIKDHAELLAPHHQARLDMALWRGLKDDASRMLPLVSEEERALAEARQTLRARASTPEAEIAKVPDGLRAHAGLAYEEFLWNYHRGSKERAIQLMTLRSASRTLGEPARWAGWRRSLTRQIMREGDPATAYQLALNHGLTEGSAFADLEWLAGYIALRKLNKPAIALAHFERFEAAVGSPISLGRAGFWKGEALAKLGRHDEAKAAYAKGAEHQTSFYGLLAAERAGIAPDPALAGVEYFPAWQSAEFAQSDLAKIVMLAVRNGRLSLAEQFILKLADGADRRTIGQLGNMAEDIGAPHLQVMLGKAAAQQGIVIEGHYYALHPLAKENVKAPKELALAIARRESEFDPSVVSGAGAEGLMQLMPATAAEVAGDLGLEHERAKVRSDWRYNAQLGTAYLAKLAERFDGNIVMISAAYNAGPSRPERWMSERGDPRKGDMDVIDWIEHIPFNETRNYVMRVAESLPVYRARLGLAPHPTPFSQELVGATMR